jgi:hypothetical protein
LGDAVGDREAEADTGVVSAYAVGPAKNCSTSVDISCGRGAAS